MSYLTATELQALIQQTPAYRNANNLNDMGGSAAKNPLFPAAKTVGNLKFARDGNSQLVNGSRSGVRLL